MSGDSRNLLTNLFGSRRGEPARASHETFDAPAPAVQTEPEAPPARAPQTAESLQSVGREAEELREKVTQLWARLDDLQSIKDEFDNLSTPLNGFISDFANSKRKIAEMNAVLAREEELRLTARVDLVAAERNAAQLAHELRMLSNKLQEKEALAEQSQATISHYRALLEEKTALHDATDKELFSANEKLRALSIESQALKQELASLTRTTDAQTRQIRELNERAEIQAEENARLLHTVEALSSKAAEQQSRLDDLTQKLHQEQQDAAQLQAKLAAEQQAAMKAAELREAERASLQKEASSLAVRVETTANRLAATEKLLAHVRTQATEQAEAYREAEKSAKDAAAAQAEAERALEIMREAHVRQTSALQEAQQFANDLKDKFDALTKAAAAKDVLVETSVAKAASLEARLDQITQRYESERASSEAAFRRTLEELQNERAERLLLQGALDIARSGRSKLLSEITALKRRAAGNQPDPIANAAGEAGPIESSGSGSGNIRAFKTMDREDEKRAGTGDRGGAWNGDSEEAVGARK